MDDDSRAAGTGGRGWAWAAAALACAMLLRAPPPRAVVEDGWRRLDGAELEALSARRLYVRLGATEVIYHVSPSGAEVRAHYPSMAYRTRYRRKVEGARHCYHAAALPFTGWRCYSVWRKGDALRERPAEPFG